MTSPDRPVPPLTSDQLHQREVDGLEARLWANDEMASLAGYRQLAFDSISLLKDSTYADAARAKPTPEPPDGAVECVMCGGFGYLVDQTETVLAEMSRGRVFDVRVPDGEPPVRAMYDRLARAHEAEPTVPDHGGGLPGDKYPLDLVISQPTPALTWYSPCGYRTKGLFSAASPIPTCPNCLRSDWATFPSAAIPQPTPALDVDVLAEAMDESYYPDEPPGVFIDDAESFWRPFAAKVLARLRATTEPTP